MGFVYCLPHMMNQRQLNLGFIPEKIDRKQILRQIRGDFIIDASQCVRGSVGGESSQEFRVVLPPEFVGQFLVIENSSDGVCELPLIT